MKITSIDIIGQLERMAEALPWDAVDLWIKRKPDGKVEFTAYVRENEKFGFPSQWGAGETPSAAVDQIIERCVCRDPEIARANKVAELKAQIEKLQAVVIGMPPWKPGRTLSNGEAAIEVKETVNV